MDSYITRFYAKHEIPKEILVSEEIASTVLQNYFENKLVVPQKGQKKNLVDIFHNGLDLYLSGKFREAGETFSGLYKNYGDLPSKTYMERCACFIKNPPPSGWDGIYNITSK